MSKRVLILSASAGAGHMRAADALLPDFRARADVADVQHWDILKYTNKLFEHIYSKVYLQLANKAPGVMGYVYKSTDKPWKNQRTKAFEKFNAGPFIKALMEYEPDLIVCTHFTPADICSELYAKKELRVRPAIVVTDFDLHAMWLVRHYERYFVALDETKVYLEKMGISPGRVTVSGIPVDPVFRVQLDAKATRRKLGLAEDRFTILVSAGGFGVGPIEELIKELFNLREAAQVVAIAGRSEALKAKLDRLANSKRGDGKVQLTTVGFTKQMDEYMAAADLLISKPGGLTTSEAMARGLPMVVANPIPGQEERNADHLLEAGCAIKCNNVPTLAFKIDRLRDAPGRMDAMRAAARAFGRPLAALEIVETLLGKAPAGSVAS